MDIRVIITIIQLPVNFLAYLWLTPTLLLCSLSVAGLDLNTWKPKQATLLIDKKVPLKTGFTIDLKKFNKIQRWVGLYNTQYKNVNQGLYLI